MIIDALTFTASQFYNVFFFHPRSRFWTILENRDNLLIFVLIIFDLELFLNTFPFFLRLLYLNMPRSILISMDNMISLIDSVFDYVLSVFFLNPWHIPRTDFCSFRFVKHNYRT